MNKIVVLDKITLGLDIDLSGLNQFGEVVSYDNIDPSEVEEAIKDAKIVLSNKVLLNKSNLENNKSVKFICICATGVNNVDLEYAREKGIVVTNVAGYSTASVTQHTFATLLYLGESLNYYNNYTQLGEYAKSPVFTHLDKYFNEIKGKTFGIIGMGNIGKNVASLATAFGATIIYYSTSGKNTNTEYKSVDLDTLLKISDIVSIHCPLNENTKYLIGYNEIKKMKPTAYLLNMGRGGIIKEEDLAKALNENLIKVAALDVFEKEPIEINNSLLNINNKEKLLLTPHIAWASVEARKKLISEVIENIKAFLNGENRNKVN